METSSVKPATWFWVVASIALVWNLIGAMAYIAQVMMTPEAMELLSKEERTLIDSTPAWATGGFAIAVWGGTLGCILLLLRKKLATPILVLSLIGIMVQQYHSFFMTNAVEVYGTVRFILPVMVIVIAIYLVWFSRNATAKGWLN